MARIGILVFAMLLSGTASGEEIEPSSLLPVEEGDSPERIVEKAAHVVPTPRQLAYHRNEFIAFIHWGPNAFTRREWGTGMEDPKVFNPPRVDTDQWCRLMKAAGMRQVVLVAKHHDGFCMWQTRYSKHGVMSSPWKDGKGDVVRQLSESCRKHGLKLGIYLSPADLFQIESEEGLYGNGSSYSERTIPRPVPGRPFEDRRTFRYRVDDYNEYFMNQLFELLTEYGPVHEVWFDGAHPKRKGGQTYTHAQWYELIRTLVPDAVIFGKGPDVRWCGNEGGRTRESEWNVVPLRVHPDECTWPDMMAGDLGSREKLMGAAFLYYYPAETNTSIRHGWFYRDDDIQQVRSADDVFNIYERSVGGSSVFLLNIPPNREGTFSPRDAAVLEEVGRRIGATYGASLLEGAEGPGEVLDRNPDTFWSPEASGGEFEIGLPEARQVNRFVLQEELAGHGQRVEEHALDARVDGAWKEVAKGTTIGYKRILRFAPVLTDRFRVRILRARLIPTVSSVDAHFYRQPPGPVAIARNREGKVAVTLGAGAFEWNRHGQDLPNEAVGGIIRYTLDGSDPSSDSPEYETPFDLADGGRVKAAYFDGDERGPVCERFLGMSPAGWKLLDVSSVQSARWGGEKAFDGNPLTAWRTSWKEGHPTHPHHLAIDLGREVVVSGFLYQPNRERRAPVAMIEAWRIETSDDGEAWTPLEEGEFGNLLNDPTERLALFEKKVKTRYFRIVSLRGVQENPFAAVAELGVLLE